MAVTTPDFLQVPDYDAIALRRVALDSGLGNGVLFPTTLKVTQRAAGANLSVDVAAGAGWVTGSNSRQGLYHLYNDAVVNKAINSNSSGNPRVDQIILRVYDSTDGGSLSDSGDIEYLPGTATASAQISDPGAANYRSGAATLPSHAIVLADVIVANAAASITNANIVDRRPWALGGYSTYLRAASPITRNSTTLSEMDTTFDTVRQRLETQGYPVRMVIRGQMAGSVANMISVLDPRVDGVSVGQNFTQTTRATSGVYEPFVYEYVAQPAAGSHLFSWWAGLSGFSPAGTITYAANNLQALQVTVEEIRKPDAANN